MGATQGILKNSSHHVKNEEDTGGIYTVIFHLTKMYSKHLKRSFQHVINFKIISEIFSIPPFICPKSLKFKVYFVLTTHLIGPATFQVFSSLVWPRLHGPHMEGRVGGIENTHIAQKQDCPSAGL